MKRYRLSFRDSIDHVPAHPERTAKHAGVGMDMDVYYQEWPSRKLAKYRNAHPTVPPIGNPAR
jgi:hypothetical protein